MARFDPYQNWLGIPPEEQPPNYYRLLGVKLFESDAEVIQAAADQRMVWLQGVDGEQHLKQAQSILSEVAEARVCLLSRARKAAYDEHLSSALLAGERHNRFAALPDASSEAWSEPVAPRVTPLPHVNGQYVVGASGAAAAPVAPPPMAMPANATPAAPLAVSQGENGAAAPRAGTPWSAPVDEPPTAAEASATRPAARHHAHWLSWTMCAVLLLAGGVGVWALVSASQQRVEAEPEEVALEPPTPARRLPPRAIAPFDADAARQHQQRWADALEVPPAYTNSLGMTLMLIPAGEFIMGAADGDSDAWANERPPHRVTLTRPYYIGVHEVTIEQFTRFADEAKHRTSAEQRPGLASGLVGTRWRPGVNVTFRKPGIPTSPRHPVVAISADDARQFCEWLSKHEGDVYRLPTEAEWEFACRAGSRWRFSHGDEQRFLSLYAVIDAKGPAPVGSKNANAFGLFDMHGNVWEFCADGYAGGYSSAPQKDPAGSAEGPAVIRGGGWYQGAQHARNSRRSALEATGGSAAGSADVGFRVVKELPDAL